MARKKLLEKDSVTQLVVAKAIVISILASLLIAGIGLYSDLVWHQNIPFESFWTPAHATLYGGIIGVGIMLLAASRVSVSVWKTVFGNDVKVIKIIPKMSYPHPLFLVVLGTIVVLIAGAVDERWHSILGGGESAYSWPHNLALSGGVILGLAGISIISRIKQFSSPIAIFGWIVLSVSWPIVLYRYIGYVRFSYNDLEELALDPHLSEDQAWLSIIENVLKYNITGGNYLVSPFAIFMVSIIFLYSATSIHPLSFGKVGSILSKYPAFASVLIYVGSIYLIDTIIKLMGYRAITPIQLLISLIVLGLLYDIFRRITGKNDLYIWIIPVAFSSLIYMQLMGYSLVEMFLGVFLALSACVLSIYISKSLLRSIDKLDINFTIYMLILIV